MNHALRFSRSIVSYFARTYFRVRKMDLNDKRRYLIEQVHGEAQSLLHDLGFEVKVFGYKENVKPGQTYLTVGNHLSYMDPFVLVSAHPSLFVTSVDMRETPVLGQICEIAGCIFVERRNRTTIEKDIAEMTNALKAGINVTIYPEGRSTDGHDVYPFKKSLLMSAVFAGRDILPVAIKYTEMDGRPFTFENSDEVAWHGDMTFTPHFRRLMKMKSVKVELHFLPPIKVTPESNRQVLAGQARDAIREAYMQGLPPRAES
jgi:1-acyl-sn-glycerol-3-phosphate acyltransferase